MPKPQGVPRPEDGYYWVRIISETPEGVWEPWEDWTPILLHVGKVYWINSEECDTWESDYYVFTDAREIKPPEETT